MRGPGVSPLPSSTPCCGERSPARPYFTSIDRRQSAARSLDCATVASTGALRSGPLCWGQYWSWQDQLRPPGQRSPNLVFLRRIEVPAAFSPADVAEILRAVIDRYEALRTTYHAGPDGAVTQVVWPADPARYEIRDLPLADEDRWPPWDFELTREWPVKIGVIRSAAGTSHLVLAVHH